jgi:hypothetical protein
MEKSAKLSGVVALLAIGGAMGVGCSSNKGNAGGGTVKIAVVNAASEGIVTVNYLIHAGTPVPAGPVIPDVVGVINVSDPSSTPSVDHSFPASTGDLVTMNAVTTGPNPVTCTGTSAPFAVTAGGVASVSVTITCPNGPNITPNQNGGDVIVSGNFVSTGDHCPLLSSWVASPLQTSGPGGVVNVSASASDADGDTLAYTWTATGGSFGVPGRLAHDDVLLSCRCPRRDADRNAVAVGERRQRLPRHPAERNPDCLRRRRGNHDRHRRRGRQSRRGHWRQHGHGGDYRLRRRRVAVRLRAGGCRHGRRVLRHEPDPGRRRHSARRLRLQWLHRQQPAAVQRSPGVPRLRGLRSAGQRGRGQRPERLPVHRRRDRLPLRHRADRFQPLGPDQNAVPRWSAGDRLDRGLPGAVLRCGLWRRQRPGSLVRPVGADRHRDKPLHL